MRKIIFLPLLVILLASCESNSLRMASSSMEPTINKGEMVRVDFNAYKNSLPKRWDIVVYEEDDGDLCMHRIVGMPGEVIRIDVNEIYINEIQFQKPKILSNVIYMPAECMNNPNAEPPYKSYRIPETSYFVLGDNKGQAKDSRFIGAIAIERIKGKALLK